MTAPPPVGPSPEFVAAFRRAAGSGGVLTFARFLALALYDPAVGYYAGAHRRIGRERGADFFTATSLGPLFGELAAGAAAALLGPEATPRHTWIEIGAEPPPTGGPGGGVLANTAHPFAGAAAFRLGQEPVIPPQAVVFSNELFDAQPFHRVVRRPGGWHETGVALKDNALGEVDLPALSPAVQAMADRLPAEAPEGYRIDLPLAAVELASRIAALPWRGLFLAFDYGKSWPELATATPAGTARAYRQHRQSNDLLADPGRQDLTCHVCWDWIAAVLTDHGFGRPTLESQEAFLVHHAAPLLSRLAEAEAGRFSERKRAMMQLLHPAQMGQKFQVLWARRE